MGSYAFTLDTQAVYHLVNGALGDSFQYSVGATFSKLPVLGQVADLTLAYVDDVDLDLNGVQVELSRSYSVIDNVSITPKVGAYFIDEMNHCMLVQGYHMISMVLNLMLVFVTWIMTLVVF